MLAHDPRFDRWLDEVERRHFANLTFPEVSAGLRALSSLYVQRRSRMAKGAALGGAGKRAAFALFYAPLHFIVVREIVHRLTGSADQPGGGRTATLVDLGCGTGVAAAAWASARDETPAILGIDNHPWALEEAAHTYRSFGLKARTVRADLASAPLPRTAATVVAAFAVNEVPQPARETLLRHLFERVARGDRLLIVEPIARLVTGWWARWRAEAEALGGRADEWRFRPELPPIVAKLDRAVRLDHQELTARSLWVPGSGP